MSSLQRNNLRRFSSARCCSFCKKTGHTINTCDDEAFITFELSCLNSKNLFEAMENPINIFKRWLLEKFLENSVMIKSFAIRKCGCTLRSPIQKCIDSITNYIFNNHNEEENNVFIPFSNEPFFNYTEESIAGLSELLMASGYSSANILDIIMDSISSENKKYKFIINLESLEKEEQNKISECSICFENYEKNKFVKLNCNHDFCGDCTIKTIKTSKINNLRCPLCRTELTTILAYTNEVKKM